MSLRWDYRIFGQGRQGMGMKTGRTVRVRHMEFQIQIKGLRLEWGIESNGNEVRVFGNKNGTRGSNGQRSGMGLYRV